MNYNELNKTNKEVVEKPNIKKLFNMNNILSQLMNFIAYIIAVASALVLIYISFIEHFNIEFDWTTMTIFSILAVTISWLNWNAFYRQRYEKIMAQDIAQNEINEYSVHARYYFAVKDWDDKELQAKIDEFNKEYTEKWLSWVVARTGCPIETKTEVELDEKGNPVVDEATGKPKLIVTKGIKDLPYKGFKFPILMWRIKNHRYPESGYRTSMEIMSLLSFQDANLNKRDLRADKKYYRRRSITRLVTSFGLTSIGASMIPDMINGNVWGAILKLVLALGALALAIVGGSVNGVKGARLKLSVVEDTCTDLERWAGKKPRIAKYKELNKQELDILIKEDEQNKELEPFEVAEQIFNQPNSQN